MIAIPLLFVGEEVLVALGQDPELARIGEPFLIWSSFGMPFMFLSFVLRQFLISHRRRRPRRRPPRRLWSSSRASSGTTVFL